MNRGLVLEFTKMHGAGNDFIVIDNRFFFFSNRELIDIARTYCPRHFGVGADGILALEPPREENHHFFMTYVNADGSPGEMCGNGARCLARFAFEAGIEERPLRFGTTSGSHEAYVDPYDPENVRLVVPVPTDVIPDFTTLNIGDEVQRFAFVMAGVPHAVCFGDDVDALKVETWGPFVRNRPEFSRTRGANVDFVEVRENAGTATLKVRCYERGVEGETLACGTGAVSSFVAASATGLVDASEVTVSMRGGQLRVGYTDDRKGIFLDGPAVTVYRGTLQL